ncbi:programmed cell death protein 2 [Nemania sp. NC0429]|nr:programmed cell death protein 2 [Nemania sp. NC0429]
MAPYDSESSEGEGEEEFTETDVLLGYASKDPGDDDSITRLGGRPDWLDPETPPSAALARCAVCKALMVLLLQLDAELPGRFPGHERRLYVFACQTKSCRRREGSVRALRSLRVAPGSSSKAVAPLNGESGGKKEKKKDEGQPKEKEGPRPPINLGETLFGAKTIGGGASSGANPFATSSPAAPSNPFASASNPFSAPKPVAEPTTTPETKQEAKKETEVEEAVRSLPKTFAETLSLNNPQAATRKEKAPPEPWPPETSQPRPYPVSYLSEAEYETLDPTPPPVPQATAKMDLDGDAGGGKEDKEVFESTMDAAFQRFADRLAQNPEQCIRYEFGGTPLLYSKTDAVGRALLAPAPASSQSGLAGVPRCASCGGPRAFEVQLCPHAITELEAEDLSLEGMDWGTVLVAVCERDCQERGVDEGGVGYLEEWVGVQWEEIGSAAPGGGGGGGGRR